MGVRISPGAPEYGRLLEWLIIRPWNGRLDESPAGVRIPHRPPSFGKCTMGNVTVNSILFEDVLGEEYSTLIVLEPVTAWYGNPRDMNDEDIKFFGLDE